MGVASSVANDVIMRTRAASAVGARRHNDNDVIMITAGLWRYGDWRHVATGCNALVFAATESRLVTLLCLQSAVSAVNTWNNIHE